MDASVMLAPPAGAGADWQPDNTTPANAQADIAIVLDAVTADPPALRSVDEL
jgi:hypothetical protein